MQHPHAALQRRDYAAFLDACGAGGVGLAAWAPYAPALGMAAVEQLDQAQAQTQTQAGGNNPEQRDKLRLREALTKLSDPFSSAVQYAESARSTGLSAALQVVVEEGRRGAQDLSTADADDFDAADTVQRMLIAALQLRQLLVESEAGHGCGQAGDVAMVGASTVYDSEGMANELALVVPMLTLSFPHLFPIGPVAKALSGLPGGIQLLAALAANTCEGDGDTASVRAVVDAAFGHLNTLERGSEVAAAAVLSRLCLLAPPATSMVRAHLVEKQLLPEMVLQLTSDLHDELEFLTSVVFGLEAKRDWLLAHLASSQRSIRGPPSSQPQPKPVPSSSGSELGPEPQTHSKRGRPDIIPLGRTREAAPGPDTGLPEASPLAKRPRLGGPGTLSAPLPRTSQAANNPVPVPAPVPIPAVSRTSSFSSGAANVHAANISLRVREALLVDAQRTLELNQERDRDLDGHARKRLMWSERALRHLRLFCVLVGAGGLRPSGEEMSMWLTAVATAREERGRAPPASPQHQQHQEEERLLSAGTLRLSLSFLCLSQGLTAPSFRPLLQRAVGRIIYHHRQPVLGNGESQAHALPQAPPQAEVQTQAHAQVQAQAQVQAREQQVLVQGQGFVKETAEEEEARQLSVWLGTQLYLRQFPAIADAVRGALGVHVRVPSTALRDVAEVASAAGLLAPDDLAATAASIHTRDTEPADSPAAQMALVALRQLLEAGVLHHPSKADIAGFAVWQLFAQKTASSTSSVNPQLLAFLRALALQDTHVIAAPALESLLHAEGGDVGTDRVRVLATCYALRVEEAARTGRVRIADVGVWDGVLTTLPVMHCLLFMRRSGTVYQDLYSECLQLATELLPEQTSASALERLQAENGDDHHTEHHDDSLNATLDPDALQRALSAPLSDPTSTSHCLRAFINHTKRTYDPKGSLPLHSSVMESISPLLLRHNESQSNPLKALFVEWWLALPMCAKVPLFPRLMAALGVDGGDNNNNNSNNGAKCSLEKMRLSPLRVLACDAWCFRIAPVLELVLKVYGMLLAMNRRLAMAARKNKMENGNSSIVTPSNTSSSLLLQASAGVQMLLEVLMELGGGGEGEQQLVQQQHDGQRGGEAKPREIILKFLDRAFSQEPLLLKLVHFQGFDLSLVGPLASGAPSVRRMCVDFLPELLTQPQPERQVLGVALAGALEDACPEALAQKVVAFVRSLMSKPTPTEHIQKMLLPLASCALAVPKVAMECVKIFQDCAEVSRALQPDAPPRDAGLHAAAAAAAMNFFERRAAT